MIYEVTGDILLSRTQALAHGIAPGDPFDHGLALALRKRWPALLRDFLTYSHAHHPSPGQAWGWDTGTGQRVITLITQEPVPGEKGKAGPARLENLNHALRELCRIVREQHLTSVALPRLATGAGGLDWKDVLSLIYAQLGMLDIPIIVYSTYHPGLQALEPLSPRGWAKRLRPDMN
jgi:O-acetyl-ADP-ribose deacetylase (regulator of RNase III)